MRELFVPWGSVDEFIRLLGTGAITWGDDSGSYFAVADEDVYRALRKYLFRDVWARMLFNGRILAIWTPRQYLEHIGFDKQRLDALKITP